MGCRPVETCKARAEREDGGRTHADQGEAEDRSGRRGPAPPSPATRTNVKNRVLRKNTVFFFSLNSPLGLKLFPEETLGKRHASDNLNEMQRKQGELFLPNVSTHLAPHPRPPRTMWGLWPISMWLRVSPNMVTSLSMEVQTNPLDYSGNSAHGRMVIRMNSVVSDIPPSPYRVQA